MQKRNVCKAAAAFLGMLILILDSKTALSAATEGIQLCFSTVIPALFPFFVLSSVITGSFSGRPIPILKPLGKLLHIPCGYEAILISGFLGGYPVGAQAVSSAYRSGGLSKEHAERMLAFCNNPGPSFLFGMVTFLFPDKHSVWLLWGITVLSAVMVGKFYPTVDFITPAPSSSPAPPVRAMDSAIKAMAYVCGWIILFRVAIAFANRWFLWLLPDVVQLIFIGFLELSNGCFELTKLANPDIRFLISGCILSFGGLCVTMQTASVAGKLSMQHYFIGKLLQTLCTGILCVSVIRQLWMIPIAALLFLCIPSKNKNSSRFPGKAIV